MKDYVRAIYPRFYDHTYMHRLGWLGGFMDGWLDGMDGWMDNTMIPGYHVRNTKSRYLFLIHDVNTSMHRVTEECNLHACVRNVHYTYHDPPSPNPT